MRGESVETPSLLGLPAVLAQACVAIWHLTPGEQGRVIYLTDLGSLADGAPYARVLDTMTRLCPDVIAAVQGYMAIWPTCFWQDGWHPAHWDRYCKGVNGALLEVFVSDTRQRALAAYERDVR